MNLRRIGAVAQALEVMAHPHTRLHFSQFGEDAVVAGMLRVFGMDRMAGFYVDVGAFDPVYLSNTRMLHLCGWHGVNIDANPDAIARFRTARPDDSNVHAAVSDDGEEVAFTIYPEAAISTADPAAKAAYAREGREAGLRTLLLQPRTLRDILDEVVPPGQVVDLMSVDVEGFDLRVLRSNDWSRFAPYILLVEDPGLRLSAPDSEVFRFLTPLGYRLTSQAYITSIYVRDAI